MTKLILFAHTNEYLIIDISPANIHRKIVINTYDVTDKPRFTNKMFINILVQYIIPATDIREERSEVYNTVFDTFDNDALAKLIKKTDKTYGFSLKDKSKPIINRW